MPLRRIFSEEPLHAGTTLRLRGEAANHVARVLRLRAGDTLIVFDGSGRDFHGEITGCGHGEVHVRVGAGHEVTTESPADITLLQGVCRGQRMDTVIQKATELGVRRIVPVLTGRSVVRLDARQTDRRHQHWQRVAIGACEQCGRSRLPEVLAPQALAAGLQGTARCLTRLLLDPTGEAPTDAATARGGPIALLVGPEGGLNEAEQRLARDCGFRAVRLGPRILRTETAPLAALAILQYLVGDLR